MSSHGGRRTGSGRKRIYDSSKTRIQVWQKGHQRIWMDYVIYSSGVSAKTKCGYSSDTAFAGHLLSLEQRRRENDITTNIRQGSPQRKRTRLDDASDVYRESGLRVIYTEEELDFLEGEFAKNKYPSREMLEAYGQRLGVDAKAMKIWSQKRRFQYRRWVETNLPQPEPSDRVESQGTRQQTAGTRDV